MKGDGAFAKKVRVVLFSEAVPFHFMGCFVSSHRCGLQVELFFLHFKEELVAYVKSI